MRKQRPSPVNKWGMSSTQGFKKKKKKILFVKLLEEKSILLLWTLSTSRSYQLVTAVSGRLELIYNTWSGPACHACKLQVPRWGSVRVPGTAKSPARALSGSGLAPFPARDKKSSPDFSKHQVKSPV